MNIKSECYSIYCRTFGEDDFARELFSKCFKYCHYYTAKSRVVSMLFLLPCNIDTGREIISAGYVFAVTTKDVERGKGYAAALLDSLPDDILLFLKPSENGLFDFYKKSGFKTFTAIYNRAGEKRVILEPDFLALADKYGRNDCEKYNAMYKFNKSVDLENLNFAYTME